MLLRETFSKFKHVGPAPEGGPVKLIEYSTDPFKKHRASTSMSIPGHGSIDFSQGKVKSSFTHKKYSHDQTLKILKDNLKYKSI